MYHFLASTNPQLWSALQIEHILEENQNNRSRYYPDLDYTEYYQLRDRQFKKLIFFNLKPNYNKEHGTLVIKRLEVITEQK